MVLYAQSVLNGAVISVFAIFLLAAPFFVHSYRRYDRLYFGNSFVMASFVLYLCCAYALIIFPLPSFADAAGLTTELYSLRPFRFVLTFFRESLFDIRARSTWMIALRHHSFLEPAFNVLLLLPLGFYLTGFFGKKIRTATFISFCVSLFFELTQLSGLYFIYPRPYRLFDVDDLITNTTGAFLGACLGVLLCKVCAGLYTREARTPPFARAGLLRRTMAFAADTMLLTVVQLGLLIVLGGNFLSFAQKGFRAYLLYLLAGDALPTFLYFFVLAWLMRGQTPGKKLLRLRLRSTTGGPASIGQLAAHYAIIALLPSLHMVLVYPAFFLPLSSMQQNLYLLGWLAEGGLLFLFLLFSRQNHRFIFDRITRTECVSTFYEGTAKNPFHAVPPQPQAKAEPGASSGA